MRYGDEIVCRALSVPRSLTHALASAARSPRRSREPRVKRHNREQTPC